MLIFNDITHSTEEKLSVTLHRFQDTKKMRSIFLTLFTLLLPLTWLIESKAETVVAETPCDSTETTRYERLFHEMHLDSIVNYTAFEQAVEGYEKIQNKKRPVLTLIDFSKPSTEKRLYVFDMEGKKLLYSSVVAHGKNSGGKYATSFSNKNGSLKSSLGFYLTGTTYQGRNGYSLILDGLEKGVNDQARSRAIVVHGADYANPEVAKSGRLGRSFGCPALPRALTRPIIDAIKGGSVLFIYAEKQDYLAQSSILHSHNHDIL